MLSWPKDENTMFTLDSEIDELNIEQYPFEDADEALVGALAHTMAAQNALALRDDAQEPMPGYSLATDSIAFWHACQAKQYLDYASRTDDRRQLPPIAADTLQQANQAIEDALQNAADNIPDFLGTDPVAKALAGARARLQTVKKLTENLDQYHPIKDKIHRRAVIRMIAYMGNTDDEAEPAVIYNPLCQAAIISLHEAANTVVKDNNNLIKTNVKEGMEPFHQILPALIDMPLGVDDTHIGMFSPGPDQDHLPDTTEVFLTYISHGIKYIQCATGPYPKGFPPDLAREHVQSIKERINSFQDDDADIPRFWEIVNNLEAAISVGLYDIEEFSLHPIVDGMRNRFDTPDGIMHHAVLALALGNVHAARFISKWYLRPSSTAPTPHQAVRILDAAKDAGLDPHQLHTLAKAINLDPNRAGITLPQLNQESIQNLEDIETLGVPYVNAEFLRNTMRQRK